MRLNAALVCAAVLLPLAARAQIVTPSMLTAAIAVNTTDILGLEQGSTGPGTGTPRKATIAQIAAAITGSANNFTALQTFSAGASVTGLTLGLTAHGVVLAEGSGNLVATAVPTAGQVLVGQGASADPSPQTIGGDCTMSSAAALTCFGASPASVAKGGTGATSLTAHGVLLGEGTSAVTAMSAMGAGALIIGQGSSADPAVAALAGDCTLASNGAITCSKTNGTAFGTAATQNTGASGANVPLLNAANTWSGLQTFSGGVASTGIAADQSEIIETSGTTYTVAAGIGRVIMNGPATFTVTMPASPIDGQAVELECWTAVTTLTAAANAGQTMKGTASSCSATQGHKWKYNSANTAWGMAY